MSWANASCSSLTVCVISVSFTWQRHLLSLFTRSTYSRRFAFSFLRFEQLTLLLCVKRLLLFLYAESYADDLQSRHWRRKKRIRKRRCCFRWKWNFNTVASSGAQSTRFHSRRPFVHSAFRKRVWRRFIAAWYQ